MKTDDLKKARADLAKAKRALLLARDIMDYCRGDAWEREATEADRKKFDKIYEELV